MNIKISKIAHHCAACEQGFIHEQPLTSAVRVVDGALQRDDYCTSCWAERDDKKSYSVWKTVYHDPKVETDEPPEVFSPLRQLFYEAVEEDSRLEMAKAFLAAGLLRRQKVFRLIKESDESDGEVRITLYTDRIGNRLIEVPDPNFSHAEMEEAGQRLMARLQELETPPDSEDETEESNQPTEGGARQAAETLASAPENTGDAPESEAEIPEDADNAAGAADGVEEAVPAESSDGSADAPTTLDTEETVHAQA